MSIDHVVNKLEYSILEADNFLAIGVDVIWHVVVSLDIHELVIHHK